MPVPVAETNPNRAGIHTHVNNVVESEGPFARMARLRQEQEAQAATATATAPATATATTATATTTTTMTKNTTTNEEPSLVVNHLTFCYPGLDGKPLPGVPPVVKDMSLTLPRSSLCLLVGPNGAGKTTLLKVLGGKHLIPESSVRVLGKSPFHAMELQMSGALSYVGGNWERDVAFAGYAVKLLGDFPASQMLNSMPGVDPARRDRVIKCLNINPLWRMHRVSDGQRRRVQIAMGLLKEFDVLLLDEITVDLDVLGRAALMRFLRQECEERGATVIYCTHIFDGLDQWPTHLMYVAGGRLERFGRMDELTEFKAVTPLGKPPRLISVVLQWLKEERDHRRAERAARRARGEPMEDKPVGQVFFNNGYSSGTLTSSQYISNHDHGTGMHMHGSSNAVMRG